MDNEPEGINRRFHPDGSVASEGTWRDGQIITSVYFRAKGESDEMPIPEGGPEVVRAEYIGTDDGRANATIRYFDANGKQRDRRGVFVPERPRDIPETARWFSDENFSPPDGSIGGWVDGPIERGTQDKLGVWRWWTTKGEWLRTETYSPDGRLKGIATPGSDQIADKLAAFYADTKAGKYDLMRAWSPALHERIRRELVDKPDAITREYIYNLDDGVPTGFRSWSRDISQPRRVIEIVEDWEKRSAKDASDMDAWYIVGAGAKAAWDVRDRPRLERWWSRWKTLKEPKETPEDSYAFGSLGNDLEEAEDKIKAYLSPKHAKASDATRKTLLSKPGDVPDEEFAAWVQDATGSTACEVLLRDKTTGEAWIHDDENQTHYWDGKQFMPSTVRFDERSRHDLAYVGAHDTCHERVLIWPGKHGWLALQRYGRSVLWHSAHYYSSRGQAEVDRIMWFRAANPVEAQRLMKLVAAGAAKSAKPIDPWFDKKLGVIVRHYSGEGLSSAGIHDNVLTTGRRFIERFGSHAEAVVAFEKLEIERMRSGSTISRFSAKSPKVDD